MPDKVDTLKRTIPVVCDECNGECGWRFTEDQNRIVKWISCPKCHEEGIIYVQE